MTSTIIEEFIQALDEEIEAIKKGKGGSIVKIFNGRFLREISGLFVYVFNLENFLAVLDDSPAEIEIRGTRYRAQVLLTQGLEFEIGIEHSCGQFIPEATLHTNLWYLLELLKKKYSECQSGTTRVDFHLSEILFSGRQSTAKSTSQLDISYSQSKDPPNDSQKRAIEASFSSQLSIIWGPPGTGKTKTAAKAIEAHLNAGRRVLLVSHSNNAVDEALEDVAEHLKSTPFYQEGKLVRLGKPQEEHLKKLEKDYELVLLDKIAAKLGESLSQEKRDLEAKKAQIESKLASYEGVFNALQKRDAILSELDGLRLSLSESERRLRLTKADLDMLEQSLVKKRERFVEAQSAGMLKRFLKGLDPQKLQYEIDQATISVDSKMRVLREIDKQLKDIRDSIRTKDDEAKTARNDADELLKHLDISAGELENKRKELEQQKDTILARIAEIDRQLDELQRKILSEARLVATTLTKTFIAKQFPDAPFDVLVLDEASMAPLPHLYWAVGRCRESVTIIGDFLQLPPICIAGDKPAAQKWLRRSIFDILGINSVKEACIDPRVKLLDTQYRMAPEISAIPNRFFYQNKLKDHPSTFNRGMLNDGISESPLVLVETSAMNPWCSQLSTGSRFNLYNALLCATLAKRLVQNIPSGRIGILTPYGPQARLINKIAKDWGLLEHLRISTIHRFQGGEENIIIFDTTEGMGLKVAPMLDEFRKPDSDARLVLNVALTRAEHRIYLVAHTKKLLTELHPDSALSRIVLYFQQKAKTIESETLVDNYFTTDFERWANELLPTPSQTQKHDSGTLFTERNFYAQLFQDIKTVKERLIILSPFLSIRRSSMFMDYFQDMIRRGIEIRIDTRPIEQQVGEMANQADAVIRQLESIGAKVIERRGMHQKVAILDNAIAWEGSLNILSHRDTGEQMRRFEGPSAIEEIIKNLELDKDMPVGSHTGKRCPQPGCDGFLVVRSKYGREFLGCSNYAKRTCNFTKPLDDDRAPQRKQKSHRR